VLNKAVTWRVALFLSWLIVLTVAPLAVGQSPAGEIRVFPTGFVVHGEFLRFFDRHGGIETFGYPLTAEFEEAGRLVQYFHRGRLELFPENLPERRVALAQLGELLMAVEPAITEPELRPDRRFFAETGHTVASAFLRYFEARGGADLFGHPITEMMVENGRIVQYFERARLEWHPSSPPGLQVQLGKLGEIYLDQYPPPPEVRDPFSGENRRVVPPEVSSLDVAASVRYPFARQNQPQTLYVFVYDQDGNRLAEAEVQALIHFPSKDRRMALAETSELGLSWQAFDVGQVPVGETVAIEVVVRYGGVEGRTQTSFLVWF
jgi:hypothetical protein